MKAEYIQRGETIYFTPSEYVSAGDVVVIGEKRVAVAASNIRAGESGVAHTVGVFAMPKGAEEIEQGADVYWDGDACTASGSSESGNVLAGYAFEPAAQGDATVAVKLLG